MGGLPWVTVGVNGYREWLGGWGEVAMIAAQGCAINCERERTRIYENLRERARNDATEPTGKRELVRKCEPEERGRGQGGARGRLLGKKSWFGSVQLVAVGFGSVRIGSDSAEQEV